MAIDSTTEMTILFADVAGSVELYADYGDIEAHRRIVEFLRFSTSLIDLNQGRVIEIIGDEIMCAFSEADDAFAAACAIQDTLRETRDQTVYVRVGFHSGLTGVEEGHPFGDTVNVAARVVGLAKAGQIMLTDQAHQRLSPGNRIRTRVFNQVYIKGKCIPYTVHQAFWETNNETAMMECATETPVDRRRASASLHLHYNGKEAILTQGVELLIGRGEQCGVRIQSEFASRIHATIKLLSGKLVLTDRSTNGTYVRTQSGKRSFDNAEIFLKHEEFSATCGGVISLGTPISDQHVHLIHFSCSPIPEHRDIR